MFVQCVDLEYCCNEEVDRILSLLLTDIYILLKYLKFVNFMNFKMPETASYKSKWLQFSKKVIIEHCLLTPLSETKNV